MTSVLPVAPPSPTVEVHARHVVRSRDGERYVRLGAREHRLLRALEADVALPDAAMDAGFTLDEAERVLERFRALGLVGERASSWARSRRWRADGVTSLRLTIWEPAALLQRHARVLEVLTAPGVLALAAAVTVLGLAAGFVSRDAIGASAGGAPSFAVVFALIAIVALSSVGHELAHAGALVRFGGEPRGMGVMLFYGSPALFSDTTDAWRLPWRLQRAMVAAAGLLFDLWCTAMLLLAYVLLEGVAPGTVLQALALGAVVSLMLTAGNAWPFVRFDGYWVLATLVDEPNLRPQALGVLHARMRRLFLGGPAPADRRFASVGWTLFAVACALSGPMLLGLALLAQRDRLLMLGQPGAAIWLAGSVLLLGIPLIRLLRTVVDARPRGLRAAVLVAGGVGSALLAAASHRALIDVVAPAIDVLLNG